MADIDEIIIANVGKDGVASEVTLQRLVSALEKTKKIDDKGRKNLKELADASKNAKNEFKSFSEEVEKTTTIMEDVGNTLRKTFTLENFGKVLGFAAATTSNFAKELTTGGNELGDFAQHIPVIGGSLGLLTGFFQDSLDTFRALSDVGAGFGNDLMALRKAAAESSMPLDMFASMVRNNTEVLRILGTSTSDGAARMGQLSKNLRNSRLGDQLFNMGFTMEELNEGLGDFMKLQARSGRLQGMTNSQLVNGTSTYLTELDKLSRQTGISRKQLQETMAADANKANLAILEAKMTREQAIEFRAGLATVRNIMPGLGDTIEDLADGIPQSGVAKKLAALSPAFARAAEQFGQGAISQEEFLKSLQTEGGPALRDWMMSLSAAEQQQYAQQEGFSELFDSFGGLNNFLQTNFNDVSAEQQRRQRITDGLSRFQNAIADVRAKFLDAFITSGLLDAIGDALVKFGDMFIGMTSRLGDYAKMISEGNWGEVFTSLIGDALSGLWENKGIVGAIIAGIGGLFIAKSVVGALAGAFKSSIGGAVSSVTGKLFGGGGDKLNTGSQRRGGPTISKNFANSAGNLGSGIGKGLGGLVKGVGQGLAALGPQAPMVLAGAAAIGGAITLIGAGIAGAAWLTGKALPTFVDGLKKFEEIDGGALLDASLGMVALSGAMAAFGAGTAVAGLGAMVGGITEGIGKLFGAEDPITKLERFSAANIDAAKVKANAEAMVSFTKAMALAGGGAAVEGLGTLVSGIAGGIGKLFGGSDTMDVVADMQKFAAQTVDKAAVQNNADAMVSFMKAMALAGAGNAAEGLGTLVSGIAGGIGKLFGGSDTMDIVADMQKFASVSVDKTIVQNNAEAMSTFSKAMALAGAASAAEGLGTLVSGIAGGIGKLFGAEDPLTQLINFSAKTIDKTVVQNNAEAMAAFSAAMSSVVMMPEKGIFASIGSAISGFFGADTPFDQLIAFGALNIDSAKVKSNAESMSAFSAAMSNVTMMPEKGIFSSFASALSGLFGGDTPFDQLAEFGALEINAEGVKTNAEAMNSMSTALQGFSSLGEVEINKNLSSRLTALANVPDLTNFASGINSLNTISPASINALNSLDNTSVLSYTTAMENLVEVLKELNTELGKDNNGLGFGKGTNAGDVLGKMESIGVSSGSGMSQETADRLNSTLGAVLTVLEESRDYHKDTSKALKNGDLQRGL